MAGDCRVGGIWFPRSVPPPASHDPAICRSHRRAYSICILYRFNRKFTVNSDPPSSFSFRNSSGAGTCDQNFFSSVTSSADKSITQCWSVGTLALPSRLHFGRFIYQGSVLLLHASARGFSGKLALPLCVPWFSFTRYMDCPPRTRGRLVVPSSGAPRSYRVPPPSNSRLV
jgi:hypothetical protein